MIQCDGGQNARKRPSRPEFDTGPLREAILAQTAKVIRRRCWMRRAAVGSALVMCYVAGMGTMQAWERACVASGSQEVVALSMETKAASPAIAPIEKAAAGTIEKTVKVKNCTPKRTRVKRSRFEVICEMSDRYLYRDADTVAAIRGYRRALRVATPEELEICPQRDSWLLMALKQELNGKESRNEKRGA